MKKPKQPGGPAPLPAALRRSLDEALAMHQRGAVDEAVAGYRKVLAAAPRQIDALMNLGAALTKMGKVNEATATLQRAREAAPGLPVHNDAGACFSQLGRWGDAVAAFQAAVALDPSLADAWKNLGHALIESGREAEATAALQRALRLQPLLPVAWFELHRAVFDDRKPAAAAEALARAVAADPGFVLARFCLGVTLDLAGKEAQAEQHLGSLHPDKKVYAGAVDSWRYAREKRTPDTRFFVTTRRLLRHALGQAQVEGLSMELGVRFGVSARCIAEAAPGQTLHGFDSFQGLPEDWHIQPRGVYSTHGEVPELPGNVAIHVGLFEDTLAPFARQHPGPLRFANIDCDLYSATRVFFEVMGDRVVPGTVLVFDEYLVNDRWRDDEFKAFQEAAAARGWRYEYLAFSLFTGQAAVRMLP